ncbi:CaiB/BaiF CoA transferase family protein [Comamonas composti]|uniref:CaiB/BaiF CoA transferase family protein n=1 Tax=Comamonas composti TaxID=408558 RepID=UPI00042723A0|nr:CoA transferase [Comamonas composti]
MQQAQAPLAGLRVIDWTHVLAGPFAGYQLSLLGAEVIRIERADGDDMIRVKGADPELAALGLGEAFVAQGAGKLSLALDARDPRAKQALAALIGSADVLLENFRPGKLAALGFDPRELIERHPRLVVCSITGFGPASDRRAYDHVMQAASGLMAANAGDDGVPRRVGFPLIDYSVGQQAALAVMSALYRRERQTAQTRAKGEWLQVSMMGAALTLLAPTYAAPLISGIEVPRSASTAFSGNPLSGTFATAQGQLAVVCNSLEQSQALLAALQAAAGEAAPVLELREAAELGDVPRTHQLLAAMLSRRTAADWEALLIRHGVPATAVMLPAQAAAEAAKDWPHVELEHPGKSKRVCVPGIGFTSSELLTPRLRAPVRRGADTRALLARAGMAQTVIEAMFADGVASEPERLTGPGRAA